MFALYIFVPGAVSHGRSRGGCADLAQLAREGSVNRDGTPVSEWAREYARRQADIIIVDSDEMRAYWRAGNCQTKYRHETQTDPLMWDDCASALVPVGVASPPDERLGVVYLK